MNFKKKINETTPGFQMAPMIDIIFILLIHFMIATIFAQWENKLGITVPTADSGIRSERQQGELIINIDSEGRIYVNSLEKSLEYLETLLAQVADTFIDQPVIIRADMETRHKDVIKVLDLCTKVDIRHVNFATIKAEDEL
ncbi:MAG: biopolymer transporter ExbD [Lentisphaerae bacterium]|jgi:biopolymer transport protein ExbD|nr:biopolymer transporter ExbD [Lentisphaerota bacterium]